MKKWNLDDFYLGFSDPKYTSDLESLKSLVIEFNSLSEDIKEFDEVKIIEKYIVIQEKINVKLRTLYSYNSLINATDVTNQESLINMNEIFNILNQTTETDVVFSRFIEKVDLEKASLMSKSIHHNIFHLDKIKQSSVFLLSEKEEILYAKLSQIASSSWNQLQAILTSTVDVDYRNKVITLSEARNLAYDRDQSIRKDAYLAELDSYKKIETVVSISLSNIKREVTLMNELRGYKNVMEKTLLSSNMSKEVLDVMIEVMKESRPIFVKYLKAKAKYLEHDNGLPFYDLFAPVGKLDRSFTYDEAIDIVNESFASYSKKLGDFSRKAFDLNWIDPFPRKGKRGGAFCSNQPQLKQSRILSNFTGSLSDISTLAHELGHGYHGEIISENTPLQWGYPMPLAETASIFCETIVTNHLLSEIKLDEERLSVLEISLQGDTQVIIDILSRFIFEEELFKLANGPISKEKMNELMISAQKEAYQDGLDSEFLHPYMWLNKGHYYSSGLSFYNFPYAFGLLFGKGLYAIYLENKNSFLEKYDVLLNLTTKANVEDVALSMGIDITKKKFWQDSIEMIAKDIEEVVSIMSRKKN